MISHSEFETDNSFAHNRDGVSVHISNAPSGRQGYFCPGCKAEMQAVIRRNGTRSHFRHDAKDVLRKGKCTYSDFSERTRIAKEFIQGSKEIRVPALYKYPPEGIEGRPFRIQRAETITAFKVGIDIYFYSDKDEQIHYGGERSDEPELKLLFKADIVLSDQREIPVLLVELVEKHKPKSDEEKSLLKWLGINTVQIRIPRYAPEAIPDVFKTTHNTKWIFNNEYERTEYLPVSIEPDDEVPESDELQRELLGESVRCRQAEIANLLRALNRCLESEPYRAATRALNDAIRRVEEEESKFPSDTHELRSRLSKELAVEFEAEETAIDRGRADLSKKSLRIDDIDQRLEERYKRKRRALEAEQSNISRGIEQQRSAHGKPREQREREAKRFVEREADEIESNITEGERHIASLQERMEKDRADLRTKEGNLGFETSATGRELDELEKRYEEILRREDSYPDSELSQRISGIADIGGMANDFLEGRSAAGRLSRARKSLNTGTYKTWYKST
jgi:hypothetical protein